METGEIGKSHPLGFKFALTASILGFNNLDDAIGEFDDVKKPTAKNI